MTSIILNRCSVSERRCKDLERKTAKNHKTRQPHLVVFIILHFMRVLLIESRKREGRVSLTHNVVRAAKYKTKHTIRQVGNRHRQYITMLCADNPAVPYRSITKQLFFFSYCHPLTKDFSCKLVNG